MNYISVIYARMSVFLRDKERNFELIVYFCNRISRIRAKPFEILIFREPQNFTPKSHKMSNSPVETQKD